MSMSATAPPKPRCWAAILQKSLALYQHSLTAGARQPGQPGGPERHIRILDDERDESLNGYDSLIQVFDLEPPQGFSDMGDV